MKLSIRDGFHLTSVRPTDKDAYLEHLNDKSISDVIPALPYPCTETMEELWIEHRLNLFKEISKDISFALRNSEGYLIGSVGVDDFQVGKSHRAEVGYWLARSYRGRGLATDALRIFVHYAFDNLDVVRLTAHSLNFNVASAKVLEKIGFQLEGRLRQHTKTRNGLFDTLVFGLLKDE